MIGSATFDSLSELVQYYQKHPLYRKMKLRYAVNQTLVEKCGQVCVLPPLAEATYRTMNGIRVMTAHSVRV